MKLPESNGHALAVEGVKPSGHGLGKAGWVTIPLMGELPETEVLLDWVEESYRAVAPKKLVATARRHRLASRVPHAKPTNSALHAYIAIIGRRRRDP